MEEFKWPKDSSPVSQSEVAAICWVLRRAGGRVEDSAGRATKKLLSMVNGAGFVMSLSVISKLLNQMDAEERKPRFGRIIRRERKPTRCFAIELAIDPATHPFPADPFPPRSEPGETPEEVPAEETPEASVVPLVAEVVDHQRIDTIDRLLYAQSAIAEAIAEVTDERVKRASNGAHSVASIKFVEQIVTEREALRVENEHLRDEIRRLSRALRLSAG